MNTHAYTEDQLVEQPAIGLFRELGWQTVSASEELFGVNGTLGRETSGEVVLASRLRAALERLNPALPQEAIAAAVDELTRDRSAMDPAAANREVYGLLKDGVPVSIPDPERGGQRNERVRVVDWDRPEANDFLAVRQISFTGPLYTCRPDIVGFVNGLPLAVLEFKKPGVPARQAFDDNLTSYKHPQNGIPALFWYNAFLIASNGTESRIGSITADWDRFFEWKRIDREEEPRRVSLEVMIRGTCEKTRLLDLVENFTLFSEHKARLVKVLGQNHQFMGVNNAIAASMKARAAGHGRGGVFWQTQGSGKSFSMVFFAQKILRKLPGNWTFVIVTDRVELDDQIAKTFKTCGAVSEAESKECHASSGSHLRQLLGGNHRYVFTLIHKFQGKAMVVSIDKATALKMHDKVRKHWKVETERVRVALGRYGLPAEEKAELQQRLHRLETVDMALIVSPGQNEIEQMKKRGLDIVPHRKRMNESQPSLDEKFKDPNDPLSLVFLCAMWLTGFDAPSCSTVYLDKPMRNHTLMQTIARANRVFPGKHSGMIVDYANVFASLERALAIYGAGKGGKTPVRDKKRLVEDLKQAVNEATAFCAVHGIVLPAIEQLPAGSMKRLERIDEAIDALISPDPLRKEFFAHERIVRTLLDAVKPDPAALEFTPRASCLMAIGEVIRTKINPSPVDVSQVMGEINALLDKSVEGVAISSKPPPVMDLSKIDFQALAYRFKESKRKNIELETLKAAIKVMLERLIRLNRTRIDFQEKFEELIEAYNAGSKNIEELFNELVTLSRALTEEQTRHVRENLSDEELTIFDILTRPAPEMTAAEREEVKRVAHLLLERLKQLLTFNWRQTTQARARVRLAIEETLDSGLPGVYTKPIYTDKCARLFEHIYETYVGDGLNASAAVQ